jgi:hypothetical protein
MPEFIVENIDLYGDIIQEKTKKCNCCEEILPISYFGNDSGGKKLRSWCKKCDSENAKNLRNIRKSVQKPDSGYACPICSKTEIELAGQTQYMSRKLSSPWVCDHNHDSKTFRGWLCRKCNLGLGNFDDNIEFLQSAISYLKNTA